jgi:hypothetical protein
VRMQVDRLDPGYTKVKAIVAKYNAYFGSDNRSQRDNEITQNMNIRVPAVKFDSILEELVDEGIYINYKNVSAEDVTDQFIDIEARLKTKKEVELRYLALLKDAKKVSEILEVENNLRTIREEIESFRRPNETAKRPNRLLRYQLRHVSNLGIQGKTKGEFRLAGGGIACQRLDQFSRFYTTCDCSLAIFDRHCYCSSLP